MMKLFFKLLFIFKKLLLFASKYFAYEQSMHFKFAYLKVRFQSCLITSSNPLKNSIFFQTDTMNFLGNNYTLGRIIVPRDR